jgi:hypothetical protein
LIDQYGRQVWAQGYSSVPTQVLSVGGKYTLLIEGYVSNSSPVNYSFNAQSVTNTTAALNLGSSVNGAITQAGQQNLYTFTLTNPSQLYFDSLTNDSRLLWSLSGPRGIEVNSRNFTGSDGANFGSDPVLNLVAGNYTLVIFGGTDHTGSYGFRLSDLGASTTVKAYDADDDFSATSDPSGPWSYGYRTSATTGFIPFPARGNFSGIDFWYLNSPQGLPDLGKNTSGAVVSGFVEPGDLIAHPGDTAAQQAYVSDLRWVAPGAGAYSLNAAFTLIDTRNPDVTVSVLVNGIVVWSKDLAGTGASAATSSQVVLNFGDTVDFIVANNGVAHDGQFTKIDARLTSIQSTVITPGTPVTGVLAPGNATDIYRFNANAGDVFYFDQQSASSGNTYWRLIDPYGQQVWFNSFGDVATQAMRSTGTYTLLVEGYIGNTSSVGYSFNAQNLTTTAAPLTLGSQVNGSITQPTAYTFSLANAAKLYFDNLTSDGTLNWSLIGPTGTLVNQRSFPGSDGPNFTSDPVLNLSAGSYTLFVAGGGGSINYSFRLSDLASATPITPGTAVSGQQFDHHLQVQRQCRRSHLFR